MNSYSSEFPSYKECLQLKARAVGKIQAFCGVLLNTGIVWIPFSGSTVTHLLHLLPAVLMSFFFFVQIFWGKGHKRDVWLPSENTSITELMELSSFLVYYTKFWHGIFFLVSKNNGKRITNLLIFFCHGRFVFSCCILSFKPVNNYTKICNKTSIK